MINVEYFKGKEYEPFSSYLDYRFIQGKTKYKVKKVDYGTNR